MSMSANVPLRQGVRFASRGEGVNINLGDLGGNPLNDSGVPRTLRVPHFPVSISDPEGMRDQPIVFLRPWWLWPLAILDIVVAALVFMYANALHALRMTRIQRGADDTEKLRLALAWIAIGSHQATIGLVMIIASCIPKDKWSILCLRAYLACSCLLIELLIVVVLGFNKASTILESCGYDDMTDGSE